MTNQQLGRIEKVDLRQIWPDEAADFTPWLAEHLDLLGEALRLDDLSLVEAEGQVGTFAVDVVAESDAGIVVIENQLGGTDHTHLGQLLTYAAGRDARTLIWITPQFRDEHRAALDWLNHWTPEEIEVYGVEVRAIQIGDSLPAPEFRPVAFPNTWSRQVGSRSRNSRSTDERYQRYRTFWQTLLDEGRERGLTDRKNARASSHISLPPSVGDPHIHYGVSFRGGSKVRVELDIRTPDSTRNSEIHERLKSQREAVEEKIDFELNWDKRSRGKSEGIQVLGEGSIDDPPEELERIRGWMLGTVEKLRQVIDPRLQQIVAELDAEEAAGVGGGLGGDDL